MREPSVASVGAQIAAEIPNAAISSPACAIGDRKRRGDLVEQPADAQEARRDEEVAGDENEQARAGHRASDFRRVIASRDFLLVIAQW